jgi:N-acetylglucosaminyl-diphospho-decaprenol L-rhamnosyltransferase
VEPLLSIVIINWNSVRFLAKCLNSIRDSEIKTSYEIIVADAGSFDGSKQLVVDSYPDVHFVQIATNVGFSRANNIAISGAKGEYILFLNPDTEILGTAIDDLIDAFRDSPEAGVVGARLLNSDNTIQNSCVQRFPSILTILLDAELLRRWFPSCSLWGNKALNDSCSKPTEVDMVSGACLMTSSGLFRDLGGFNTAYFMYYEDTELCWQVRKAGRRVYYVPLARLIHHGGGSTAKGKTSILSTSTMAESATQFFRVTKGQSYANLFRLTVIMAASLRLVILFTTSMVSTGEQSERVHKAVRKWVIRLRWALFGRANKDRVPN